LADTERRVPSALAAYLNDHLAGSVAGIDLADTLTTAATRANDREHALWLTDLRDALQSAQADLRAVMSRSHANETILKQVGAWAAERMTRVKLTLTTATEGSSLAWLDGLEALALGLQGQAALWRALNATFPLDDPRRGSTDCGALEQRAQMLFAEVDRARLAAAARAFS
jgi:hypothetical protein